jgi:hypothetical protein
MTNPELLPGETIRFQSASVRAAMAHSGPSHRGTASIPLVQDILLYLTDRRLIVRAEIFMGLFDSDFVAWFPASASGQRGDVLRSARALEVPVLGAGLEILTENERPHLLRGRGMRLQLFFPEAARALSLLPPGAA